MKNDTVRVRSKVWLEIHGRPVLGPGRRELLRAIDTYGSIQKAARFCSLTYRKAWGQIRAIEEDLGLPLVIKTAGGRGGGGARLTLEARSFLRSYDTLISGIDEMVDRRFQEIFL